MAFRQLAAWSVDRRAPAPLSVCGAALGFRFGLASAFLSSLLRLNACESRNPFRIKMLPALTKIENC